MSCNQSPSPAQTFTNKENCTACGNCNAIYQLLGTDRDGMIHFKIGHDETCPWLTAAEAQAEKS